MKGIKKIVAIALMATMTISFAACGEPTEEEKNSKDISTGTSQTAQISDGNSENPESSISENTEIEISNPQSEAESKNSDGTSSNPESQTSNQTSKPADTSQTSKPQTSNQNTSSNGTQTSKPATSNNTQTSKPTETSQVSKPVTKPSVQSITLNKTSLTLAVGQTAKLSYSISPSNAETGKITWSWSDSKVVSVSGDGTVTAKAAGKATVTIKTSNGKSASCNVTVKAKQTSTPSTDEKVPLKKIVLKKEGVTLAVGQKYKIQYSFEPSNADAGKITLENSNPDAVSLSSDGTVTARKPNEYADITITSSTGRKAYFVVTTTSGSQADADKIVSAYQQPYNGKTTGWQSTVIADLRKVGEEKYNMTWEDSFYVKDKGYTYNCGFNFPISNFDCRDGSSFRSDCLYQFEELERQSKQWGEDISDARFKIVIEDLGVDKYRGEHEFFVYLCYG